MSPTSHDPAAEAALRERAAEWCVRLSSDAAVERDWLDFEAWLSQSPDHLRAYEAAEAVWGALDAGAPTPAAGKVVALRPRPRRPAVWIGAVAASLVVVAVALGVMLRIDHPSTETYQTARGERRVVVLADGSRVTLNGGSQITVRLGRRERDVVMAEAEAAFDVAKDPARPFVIQAGDRQIRVVGTEFNVLRHAGLVRVAVRRGIVEVRPGADGKAAPVARLHASQGLTHREGAAADKIAAADTQAAFAWTQGRMLFRNERLEDVALTLDRYVDKPIVVDPNARNIRVTAMLTIEDGDTMTRRLSEFLPIEVRPQAGALRMSLRQGAR